MKTTASILTSLLLASCADVGPWTTETQWGTFSQDANGEIVIVPHPRPIVVRPTK
jgi:hypothetical protein